MKSKQYDPLRLDVEAFAKAGAQLEGEWSIDELQRFNQVQVALADAPSSSNFSVTWRIQGELKQSRANPSETRLFLQAGTQVKLECQRCLSPVLIPLHIHRIFLFVRGEDAAAELDANIEEEDVLALTRSLDTRTLVEDELLMSLPIVPKHDTCPAPLPFNSVQDEEQSQPEQKENPFAVLAVLKHKGSTE